MQTNQKPLVGVISSWRLVENRIHGKCVLHKNAGHNGIEEGFAINTSSVISIVGWDDYKICETKNSRYILI